MILSHQFAFVFMHNPKAGGTTVRDSIARFSDDETPLYGVDRRPDSPAHGHDRAHIGIDEFARFYPDLWARVRAYRFFALIRPPEQRILSSTHEYSRRYADTDIRFLNAARRRDFLFATLDRLAELGTAEATLPHEEFTHFRPQWIYTQSDTHPVKADTFALSDIEAFFAALEARTGQHGLAPVAASNPSERLPLPGPLAALAANTRLRNVVARTGVTRILRRAVLARGARTPNEPVFPLDPADRDRVAQFAHRFYASDYSRLPFGPSKTSVMAAV